MTLQDILSDVMTALRPLVGNRAYTFTFPQGASWPAIRVSTISATPSPALDGDGGDEGADFRLQVDVVTKADDGQTAHSCLRADVMQAIGGLGSAYQWDGQREDFEATTRTFRTSLDFVVYLSSDPPGSS